MSKSNLQAGWRVLSALLLWGALCTSAVEATAASKPYVETEPARGFHLFNRPKQKDAAAQWTYVRNLERRGKIKAACNQALALRIFWPYSAEAPAAQLLHARLLEQRKQLLASFDAYQYLVEHYVGHFEFDAAIEAQMYLAKTLMDQKKGKFLFLPGFTAPERAIPLFEKIVASAPEWRGAAEAYYLIGVAHDRIYEYTEAIDSFFTTMNRFPDSAFAERAAFDQAQCHIKLSHDAPHDKRAIDTAIAACDLYLQRYPASDHRTQIEKAIAKLRTQQIETAYKLALYYDRILHKPEAALIEYTEFVALFPNAPQTPAARARIAQLQPKPEK